MPEVRANLPLAPVLPPWALIAVLSQPPASFSPTPSVLDRDPWRQLVVEKGVSELWTLKKMDTCECGPLISAITIVSLMGCTPAHVPIFLPL